jgi:hypothetical protein
MRHRRFGFTWLYACGLILIAGVVTSLSSGCSSLLCNYGDCGPYYQEKLDESRTRWDYWLGKSKDDRIKSVGPPTACSMLTTGEEVCEWAEGGVSGGGSYNPTFGGSSSVSSYAHRRIFTYDQNHIAVAWSYRGTWGESRSRRPESGPQASYSGEAGAKP